MTKWTVATCYDGRVQVWRYEGFTGISLCKECYILAHQSKASLVQLCERVKSLDIEIDPVGLIENRKEGINKRPEISPQHCLPLYMLL